MLISPTGSKSEALYARMRADILALRVSPGTPLRLPTLSTQYDVGLTPLRECLNRLVGDTLVVAQHNRGFLVAPLSRSDLLDLERSRTAIEGAMFSVAITQGDDDWEAGVVGAYHHLSQTSVPSVLDDPATLHLWSDRHDRFHAALVAGAVSPWMQRFAGQIADHLGRYQRYIQNGLRELAQTSPQLAAQAAGAFATAMALEPHRALFDAALARNASAARAAFDAHTKLSISAFTDLTAMMPDNSPLVATLGAHSGETK